jgi:hypothetical protein
MRYGGGRGRLGAAAPEYPPAGAQIYYWLPGVPAGEVKLEIRDSADNVVRVFSSERAQAAAGDRPAVADPDEDMRPGGGGGAPRLMKNAGLNRFIWDLRYPGPWNAQTRAPASGGGPTAVPGKYTAHLTVSSFGVTRGFVVRIDPRVAKDGVTLADLREQFDVGTRVRDMVSEVNQLVARVREAKNRLRGATGAATDTLAMVTAIEAKLVTPPVRYSKPELQAHITYLYSLTNQGDQKLGRDVLDRYAVLRKDLDAVTAEVNRVLGPAQRVVGESP